MRPKLLWPSVAAGGAVLLFWLFGERWRPLRPSTLAGLKEGGLRGLTVCPGSDQARETDSKAAGRDVRTILKNEVPIGGRAVKAMLVGPLVMAALLVLAAPALTADTATVRGSLTENATVAKAITGARVSVGGVLATVSGQSYAATGVPLGSQPLVVTAPGHVKVEKLVELVAGDNIVDVVLDVQLKTMYMRYYQAYSHGHYRTAWRMMHPDVLDHLVVDGHRYTCRRYARFIKSWATKWISCRYLGIEKTHRVWKTKAGSGLRRQYTNVKCVEYLHRFVWCGQTLRERGNSHWLRETGRWYLIFDNPCLAM